jgi:hypothetical protein
MASLTVPQQSLGTWAFGPSVALRYGIGRYGALGITGDLGWAIPPEACPSCSALLFSAGAFVEYHLVQGLALDPRIAYGVGYRGLLTKDQAAEDRPYGGFEWLHVTFGADHYFDKTFGIGPSLFFAAGTNLATPAGEQPGGIYWRAGLQIEAIIDLPGR